MNGPYELIVAIVNHGFEEEVTQEEVDGNINKILEGLKKLNVTLR